MVGFVRVLRMEAEQREREAAWTPTPANINALPDPIRKYIHDIETNADPAGMVRENFILKRENEYLRKRCEELETANETLGYELREER